MSQKYYAYSAAGKKGVVQTWEECQSIVSGHPGAKYKSFKSREEAEMWLEAGADYKTKHILAEPGIYFDAGTGAGNGVEVSVTDEKAKSLVHLVLPKEDINNRGFLLLGKGVTNNYGELLGCKYALQVAEKLGAKKIFGDSKLVLDYWSKWMVRKDVEAQTLALAREVSALRKKFEENGGEVIRISGDDNPADLGFHK